MTTGFHTTIIVRRAMKLKESNEARLATLHPIFAARIRSFLGKMEELGVHVLVTQALRTVEEQDALYAKGRTAPGEIVTEARGGYSHHNYGLAVDVCPLDSFDQADWCVNHPNWKLILETAPEFHLAEGAKWRTFKDRPHLYPSELPSGCMMLHQQYKLGGMAQVNKWFEALVASGYGEAK
jgi:D-alanyl-D-alanine carboxypeptidase-like protein